MTLVGRSPGACPEPYERKGVREPALSPSKECPSDMISSPYLARACPDLVEGKGPRGVAVRLRRISTLLRQHMARQTEGRLREARAHGNVNSWQ